MQLLLKDKPVLKIQDNGVCKVLDFDHLPFSLRKENVTFADFTQWASKRVLPGNRTYANELMEALQLSQKSRYAVCRACRGLSLKDSYWLKRDDEEKGWKEVNLFENPLTAYVTELSLSGRILTEAEEEREKKGIRTPELTTLGSGAKGWIRKENELYLHKVGKYEIPADEILSALKIRHISYRLSEEKEIGTYLSEERKRWLDGTGETIVHAKLFTSQDTAFVSFEEFRTFCRIYGLNPYKEAMKIDSDFYLKMQIADYILHNSERDEQNWGFFMDNDSGKITGFCPLFDHDHAFSEYANLHSQTTEEDISLKKAAIAAQQVLQLDLDVLERMARPGLLTMKQWDQVLTRKRKLDKYTDR